MLILSRGERRVAAMLLDEPEGNVTGIVQCLIDGCHAHIVLLDNDPLTPQAVAIDEFLTHHHCDASRYAGKPAIMVIA